ncbi:MAG: hypothetical protein GX573_09140 [Chloroflexi bacterium]|nr:hypothetical protein [Chloroflexota bacterium]
MREWKMTAADPMAPRISADARAGRTNIADDQTWQLRLGKPEEPAVSLETRYGGRVGLVRLIPMWTIDAREVYQTQGYHQPPVLKAFAPDFLRLDAAVTHSLPVTIEFWTMESQAVGGRLICQNTGDLPRTFQVGMSAGAARETQALKMFFLSLENGEAALQLARLPNLQPVLLVEGATGSGSNSRLSRTLTLAPGERAVIRWALGGLPERDASLGLAYKWLTDPNWDTQISAIEARASAQAQIETGRPEWDAALAWSQQLILRSFLGPTGNLPHASFVTSRKINQGFAVGGAHAGGFSAAWGGQTVPDALLIAPEVARSAPELAKGIVLNFLAVQRDDGWIDACPGLDGQRANVLAPPLLASLAYTVYHITRDRDFLASCADRLVSFFQRWFKPDMDRDGDGLPEWSQLGQGAFAGSPTLGQNDRWAQGLDVTTVEAPDLAAYLIREGHTLLRIAELVDRPGITQAIQPRLDTLQSHLEQMWDAESGGFHYRDRDSHAAPRGELIYQGKGDQPLRDRTALPAPGRLILRAAGGLSHKPRLGCTVEGIDAAGKPANESVPGEAFTWYRGSGAATTRTVWREITYLKFDGLSRVYSVEVRTVNLSAHDQSLFMPLWTGTLADEQVERLVAALTDPERYWRAYGISGCPADSPVYDPAHQNGCGGMWPEWNARIAGALLDRGYVREAVELFERVIGAQIASLRRDHVFRALYNADTGEGLGDSDVITGVVPLGWFGRLFGAHALDPGAVAITGALAFEGEPMRWTQHGVVIERGATGTTITFPTGHQVTLEPDAPAQIVRDPNAKARPAPEPPSPPPASRRPGEGLLPAPD